MDIFEAKNRVFFISAKEVLAKRSHDERGTPIGRSLLSFLAISCHCKSKSNDISPVAIKLLKS